MREPEARQPVIGEAMAEAASAEERRLSEDRSGPSPMPAERYDVWRGQMLLYDPEELPLDAILARLAGEFRAMDRDKRAVTRHAISMGESYTLMAFARRSAVFAMRRLDGETLSRAVAACAAVELARVDWRDVLVVVALLHHAAVRIGVDPGHLLEDGKILGDPALGPLIDGFLARSAAERDLRQAWGYVEVMAPRGVGLFGWGYEPWMPTFDLPSAAADVAALVSADTYQADDPMLATKLPLTWLAEAADTALGAIVGSARGTVSVSGRLRPAASEDHDSQHLTVFILEASDPASAARLAEMARHGRRETALLGVASGSLFALVVARSWVEGVAAFESTTSLSRFTEPLVEVLNRHSS